MYQVCNRLGCPKNMILKKILVVLTDLKKNAMPASYLITWKKSGFLQTGGSFMSVEVELPDGSASACAVFLGRLFH